MAVVATISARATEVNAGHKGPGQVHVSRNTRVDDRDDDSGAVCQRPHRLGLKAIEPPELGSLRIIGEEQGDRLLHHLHLRFQFDGKHIGIGLLAPDLSRCRALRALCDPLDDRSAVLDAHRHEIRGFAGLEVGEDVLGIRIHGRVGDIPVVDNLRTHHPR